MFIFVSVHSRISLTVLLLLAVLGVCAQVADVSKMSRFVAEAAGYGCVSSRGLSRVNASPHNPSPMSSEQRIMSFVRVCDDASEAFAATGSECHASVGNISIVSVPVSQLGALSLHPSVSRIEAGPHSVAMLDTVPLCVNSRDVALGTNLPQAFTGKGVLLGIQDIGFDLTHPNFYSADFQHHRIKAFWDQLAPQPSSQGHRMPLSIDDEALNYGLPVGVDIGSTQSMLRYAHSFDGKQFMHGTHTLGIAAGTGCGSPYRGMAWESDLCVVANATSNNIELVDENRRLLYTTATDALGFKYIFDYADKVGKPCVISFSEGGHQDLDGNDQLFYEFLERITGPGRIIVASAGNDGNTNSYVHKLPGEERAGTFVSSFSPSVYLIMRSSHSFTLRTVVYNERPDTLLYHLDAQQSDTLSVADTLQLGGKEYIVRLAGYPSCYNPGERAYEYIIQTDRQLGRQVPVSVEMVGLDADVELFRLSGSLVTNDLNVELCHQQKGPYTIGSPGSAPCVICVGATSHRNNFFNAEGVHLTKPFADDGTRANYSAMGPTLDGRVKPDVLAPGSCVVSSMNSYYLAADPSEGDVENIRSYFQWKGRTYAWNSSSGTSMSTPVVAGAIALWLQADPMLTPSQVLDIISLTSRHTDVSASYPNNIEGYGEIDVYAGMVEVLSRQSSAIGSLIDRHQPAEASFALNGKMLSICFPSEAAALPQKSHSIHNVLTVSVYSTSGQLLLKQTVPTMSGSVTIDLKGLPSGIYAVQLSGGPASLTGSTLIRL